jgi:hypothetical protein
MRSNPARARGAVCFIDWSGPGQQQLVIGWSVVDGIAAAHRFGDLILKAPRPFNEAPRTSVPLVPWVASSPES